MFRNKIMSQYRRECSPQAGQGKGPQKQNLHKVRKCFQSMRSTNEIKEDNADQTHPPNFSSKFTPDSSSEKQPLSLKSPETKLDKDL